MAHVWALDFDGVVCNSQGESSRSGYKAVQQMFPEVLKGTGWEEAPPDWLLDKMRQLRPIVETGYENILLVRLLIEEGKRAKAGAGAGAGNTSTSTSTSTTTARPLTMEEVLAHWGPGMRQEVMDSYGLHKEELIKAFGSTRDDWIKTDMEGWLNANKFYEGVVEAINECFAQGHGENVYIITTKDTRFADALLKHAGLNIPIHNIYGLGSGPKAQVLAQLIEAYAKKGDERGDDVFHFVEDRVETLEGMLHDEKLKDVHLYLVDWGFNTPEQRARGQSIPRIKVIDRTAFTDIMTAAPPPSAQRAVPASSAR